MAKLRECAGGIIADTRTPNRVAAVYRIPIKRLRVLPLSLLGITGANTLCFPMRGNYGWGGTFAVVGVAL